MTASGTIMQVSEKFHACRVLVHDDAFEAQITLHMVLPLLKNVVRELKRDYLYKSGVFLRRSLTRYLVLALFRLIDKPNESGATGVTASISSLLEMAKAEKVLTDDQIRQFTDDFNEIKSEGAQGEYDLVQAIRNLRTIQVAHSLIPKLDPTDQVWAHDLADFAEAIFNFVVDLEAALEKATGITLTDLRENADAGQFWRALTSMK